MNERIQSPGSGQRGGADEAACDEARRLYRQVADIATRRWRTFLAVLVAVAAGVQLVAFFWPATYAAVAAVELTRMRYPAPVTPDRAAAPTLIANQITEEEVNSQVAVLTSNEVLEPVVKEAGLDQIPPRWYMRILLAPVNAYNAVYYWYHDIPAPTPTERAVRSLALSLNAERMKDSNVLAITYTAGDPRMAQAVLDLVLKRYVAYELKPERSRDTQTFFDAEAQRTRDELSGYEDALLAIKQRAGSGDLAAELNTRLALDADLRKEDWALRRQAADLDQRIASYRETLASDAKQSQAQTTIARNDAALQLLQSEALKLELEHVRLHENYQPDSPLIVENQRKLDAARQAIAAENRGGFSSRSNATSPARLQIETSLDQAVAERAGIAQRQGVLDGQLAASRQGLEALNRDMLEATRLQRLVDVSAEKYASYLRSGEAARIDAALDARRFSNVAVLQQAVASARPVKPTKLMAAILSLVGGLLAALAACAWLELRGAGFENAFVSLIGGTAEATP